MEPDDIPTFLALAEKVDHEGGAWVTQVSMPKAIATITHRGRRMSEQLAQEISELLHQHELAHWPDPLPQQQEEWVLIYRPRRHGGDMFEHVRQGTTIYGRDRLAHLAYAICQLNQAARPDWSWQPPRRSHPR